MERVDLEGFHCYHVSAVPVLGLFFTSWAEVMNQITGAKERIYSVFVAADARLFGLSFWFILF